MSHHDQTVVVETRTYAGTPGPGGTSAETITPREIPGCNIQQAGTTDSLGATYLVTDRWLVICDDLHEWVRPHDKVTVSWSTDTFYVEGNPAHFRAGFLDHTEFIITTSTGA